MELEQFKQKELNLYEIESNNEQLQNSLESPIGSWESSLEQLESTEQNQYESVEQLLSPTEFNEIVTDLEMTEEISEYLESVEELRYENWSKLSPRERITVLNKIEQQLAQIEHRPALKVESELMAPRTFGYQSAGKSKIALNSLYVNANSPEVHREVIDTIIHEGRHAYQHYNVDVRCVHESLYEVEQWRENFYNPKYGYYSYHGQKIEIPFGNNKHYDAAWRLYYYQPVEVDARKFAGDVMTRLEAKGIVSATPQGKQ